MIDMLRLNNNISIYSKYTQTQRGKRGERQTEKCLNFLVQNQERHKNSNRCIIIVFQFNKKNNKRKYFSSSSNLSSSANVSDCVLVPS